MNDRESPCLQHASSAQDEFETDIDTPKSCGDNIVEIPLSSLLPADSPRIGGINEEHAQTLADLDDELEPIVVHYESGRVVDGEHRRRSAHIRGEKVIRATIYSGTDAEAFVLAVQLNRHNCLPLTLQERRAAAERILEEFPTWSDRAIAAAAGVSNKTVARLRKCATEEVPQLDTRIGRDGRTRPTTTAEKRRRAADLIRKEPNASLRAIGDATGLSPTTVRDVKQKLNLGLDPILPQQRRSSSSSNTNGSHKSSRSNDSCDLIQLDDWDWETTMEILKRDPTLRLTESGRRLLNWLIFHTQTPNDIDSIIGTIPPHCYGAVARIAQHCSIWWINLARRLEQCDKSTQPADGA